MKTAPLTMEGYTFTEPSLEGRTVEFRLEFEDTRTDSAGRRHYSLHWEAESREDKMDPRTGADRRKRAQHFFAVPPNRKGER